MKYFFDKLLQFFQGSSGEMSSKRLGYLSTIPFATYGTYKLCNKLINSDHADLAVNIWNSFFIFSAFLGGFVTIELVIKLIAILKGNNEPDIKN